MQCQSCGYRNMDDAVICASCGERLSAPVQPFIPPAPQVASPPDPGGSSSPSAPTSPPQYPGSASPDKFQNKHQYMTFIRSNTAWPFYRGTINIIANLGYCSAVLAGIIGLFGGLAELGDSPMAAFLVLIAAGLIAALIFYGVSFWKEAALMIADIGDSITDTNFRSTRD